MNVLQYILFVLLVLMTVFNIYILTIGKKKRKQAAAAFKQTLAYLENKTFDEMKKRKLHFSEKHGYINDLNEGILLTFDHEKEMMGITLKEAFYLIPFDDILSCKERHDTLENGKWTNIGVELETKEQFLTLLFGSRKWKPTSTLAKFIISDAEEFCSLVNAVSNNPQKAKRLSANTEGQEAGRQKK